MTIAERIKARRLELGMTQEELAHKIGYSSRTSINHIELGHQQLTQKKIKDIATALETTPLYIMGWEDEEAQLAMEAEALADAALDRELMNAIMKIQKLSHDNRNKVYGYIDAVLTSQN